MANAWGVSWGSAWGVSWGQAGVDPTPVPANLPGADGDAGYKPRRKRTDIKRADPSIARWNKQRAKELERIRRAAELRETREAEVDARARLRTPLAEPTRDALREALGLPTPRTEAEARAQEAAALEARRAAEEH